jgi:hypothetical protein
VAVAGERIRLVIDATDAGSAVDAEYTSEPRFGLRRVPQWVLGDRAHGGLPGTQGPTMSKRETSVGVWNCEAMSGRRAGEACSTTERGAHFAPGRRIGDPKLELRSATVHVRIDISLNLPPSETTASCEVPIYKDGGRFAGSVTVVLQSIHVHPSVYNVPMGPGSTTRLLDTDVMPRTAVAN